MFERIATGIGVDACSAPYPPGCRFDDASRRRVNAAPHNAGRGPYDISDLGPRGRKCTQPSYKIVRRPDHAVTRMQSFLDKVGALAACT
jgi:hypothetical protein